MLLLQLSQAKRGFFDRAAVLAQMDRKTADALSKAGAYVRQRAKTSLRYRKRASLPGQPPSAHRTATIGRRKKVRGPLGQTTQVTYRDASPLREFIFFSFEGGNKTVIVGPTLLSGPKSSGVAPRVLEYGGYTQVRDYTGGYRRIFVRARPYMSVALEAELPNFPGLWKA